MSPSRIVSVEGRGLPLVGDDIDTDRIMPARHLRAITFDGLEQHLFGDDRAHDARSADATSTTTVTTAANFRRAPMHETVT